MEQFRVAIDTGILTADGTGANPTGLLNASEAYTGEGNPGAVDLTSGWTFALAMEFLTDLANANALRGSLGWVMNPTDWSRAIQMPSGTSGVDVSRIVTQDGAMTRLLGYPIRTTTILANGGTTGGEETVIFGAWNNIRVPFWRTLELAATAIGASTFLADQTVIRGILYADTGFDHLDAFSIGTTAA
jgi:HK97 family phage major capsid protein